MEIPTTLSKHDRLGEIQKAKESIISTLETQSGVSPKDAHASKPAGVEAFYSGFKSKLGAAHHEPNSVTVEKIHHGSSPEEEEMMEEDFSEDDPYVNPLEEIEGILKLLSELKPVTIIYGKDRKASMGTSLLQTNKETIFEDEVPSAVKRFSETGFQAMAELNIKEGLLNFRRAEIIINSFLANNGTLHHDVILHTLINLGIAYYKIGFLEDSLVCFEDSLICLKSGTSKKKLNPNSNFNNTNVLQNEYFQQLSNKIKYKRLRCKLHMQCCIVLSEMGKHEEALVHGKYASKLGRNLIVDSLAYCYHLIIREMNEEKNLRSRSSARNLTKTLREPRVLSNNKKRNKSEEQNAAMKTTSAATLPRITSNNDEINFQVEQGLPRDSSKGRLQEKMTESEPLAFQNANNEAKTSEIKEEETKETQGDQETKRNELNKAELTDYAVRLIPILKLISGRLNDLKKELGPSKKEFVLGILERACGELKSEEANLKTLTEKVNPAHWILGVNILSLLQLKPMSFEEISKNNEFEKEIEPTFILEKISDVAASLYCCSTETRFLEEKFLSTTAKSSVMLPFLESEIWLGKSLEISFIFLPHETPFVGQIISVYNKFHSVLKQPIPEDEELNENYEYIKPLKGSNKPIFFISLVKKRGKGPSQPKLIDESAESSFLLKKKFQIDSLNPAATLGKERGLKSNLLEAPQVPHTLGKLRVKKLIAPNGGTTKKAEALAMLEKIYSADQPTQIARTTMLVNGRAIKKQDDVLKKNEELIRKNDEILKKTEEKLRLASDANTIKRLDEPSVIEQKTPGLPPKPGTGNKNKQLKEGGIIGAAMTMSLTASVKQMSSNPVNGFLSISGENKSGQATNNGNIIRLPQDASKLSSDSLRLKKNEGSTSNTYNMGVLRKLAAKKKLAPKTQNFMDPEAITIVNPNKKIKFGDVKNVGIQINNNINLIINNDKNAQNINLEAISRQLNEHKIFEKLNNNVQIGGSNIRIKNKKNFRIVRESNPNPSGPLEKRDLLSNLIMDKGKDIGTKESRPQYHAGNRKLLVKTPDPEFTAKSTIE